MSLDGIEQYQQVVHNRNYEKEIKALREALFQAWEFRQSLMKLTEEPMRPRYEEPKKGKSLGERTVILHLSDWHCGEVVDLEEMEGVNKFNVQIFRNRVNRLIKSVKDLLTVHWKGKPAERLVIIFGGDMITGEIHNELAKTNDKLSAPAIRECCERLAGLLKELSGIAPIDVYSIPGNHGRLTMKPESKGMAVNSYDTLISHLVEMSISGAGIKNVRFFYPKSGDAVFKVYHLTFVAAHGDRIGSRGGTGFIGPIATIMRGVTKVRSYYAAQNVLVDYVLVGHFHTTSKLPRGFSNGSLIGPSEYSRDLRADPEQSKQNMIVVHSERGVIDFQELKSGDATEGSIYHSGS